MRKYLVTIICLAVALGLTAQETLIVSTTSEFISGGESVGDGLGYGVDVQKHLFSGVYAVGGYATGHLERGRHYGGDDSSDYQSSSLRHYHSFQVGARKRLRVSPAGAVSLSLLGIYTRQNRVDWDVSLDNDGRVDLAGSQEQYSFRGDLGYGLAVAYHHEVRAGLHLGVQAGFRSHPQIVTAGLSVLAAVGEPQDPTAKRSTSKNWIEFRIGVLGGDGVSAVPQYTLEYGRQVAGQFSAYFKYGVGRGVSDRNLSERLEDFSSVDQMDFDARFLAADHEGDRVILHPIHHTTLGAGARYKFSSDGASSLSLSAGASWFRSEVVRLRTFGSQLDFYRETYDRFSYWTPEIGIHYDYDVTSQFYVGVKINYGFERVNIGVGIHVGLRF